MSGEKRFPWGRWIFLGVQLLITGLLLWWILSRPGFVKSFLDAWRNIHAGWLAAGIGMAGASIMAHIWRWWICLRLLGLRPGWWRLCSVFLASTFIGTFVIGGIGGDAARIVMLAKDHPGSRSKLAVSVIADRLCGLVSLIVPALVFTLPARHILSATPAGKAAVHFLWGYLVLSTALFLFCFFCGTEKARRWLPQWMPARDWMLHVSDCFELLRPTGARLLAGVAASLIMIALHFATFWCIAEGCRAGVSLAEINTVMPVIDSATTVPATPGGIGMREELFRDLLRSLAGTPDGAAVLISLAGFLCGLVWCLLGGFAAGSLLPRALHSSRKDPDAESA